MNDSDQQTKYVLVNCESAYVSYDLFGKISTKIPVFSNLKAL